MEKTNQNEKATGKQLGYLKGLAQRKGISLDDVQLESMTKSEASNEIDKLEALQVAVVKQQAVVNKGQHRDILVGLAVKLQAQQYIKGMQDFTIPEVRARFARDAKDMYAALVNAEALIRASAVEVLQ